MSRKSNRSNSFSSLPPWAQIGILAVVAAVFIWTLLIKPAIDWAQANVLLVVGVLFIVLVILAVGAYLYLQYKTKEEEAHRAKGLEKFVDRHGKVSWVKPTELPGLRKADEEARKQEELVNRVYETIKRFKPARAYQKEFPYQIELVGFLKSQFSDAVIEQSRGSTRPDIVIGDIAIEVKGPTGSQELQTIADKAMRYMEHFNHLIVVLFKPEFSEGRYEEWLRGLNRTYPDVRVVRIEV